MKTLLLLSILFLTLNSYKTPPIEKKPGSVIKLYPNPSFDGSITLSSTTTDVIHFYIFDLEGKMLHQLALRDGTKVQIAGLKKGTYMYNVFKKDENIEGGKILVK